MTRENEIAVLMAKHCGDYRDEDFPDAEYAELIHKFGCSDITPEQLKRLAELDSSGGGGAEPVRAREATEPKGHNARVSDDAPRQ